MARRKNAPDVVKVKCGVAERLRELRLELVGERGGPELARRLALPVRTWYNYEAGVTVPAEVVLRLMELTNVEATWLLHGMGPKFRRPSATPAEASSVESVLRSALARLERGEIPLRESPRRGAVPGAEGAARLEAADSDLVLVDIDSGNEPLTSSCGPRFIAARREWQEAERDQRCLRVSDDAMAPLVASGAYVAYTDQPAPVDQLDGRLVVAWIGEEPPIVRWLQYVGHYVMLRAESAEAYPLTRLIDVSAQNAGYRFRAVSWISTPR
jgi:hypothetical protein